MELPLPSPLREYPPYSGGVEGGMPTSKWTPNAASVPTRRVVAYFRESFSPLRSSPPFSAEHVWYHLFNDGSSSSWKRVVLINGVEQWLEWKRSGFEYVAFRCRRALFLSCSGESRKQTRVYLRAVLEWGRKPGLGPKVSVAFDF